MFFFFYFFVFFLPVLYKHILFRHIGFFQLICLFKANKLYFDIAFLCLNVPEFLNKVEYIVGDINRIGSIDDYFRIFRYFIKCRFNGSFVKERYFLRQIDMDNITLTIFLIPVILNKIPLATLAAVLILIGYKLANPAKLKHFWEKGKYQFIPFIATLLAVA